MCLLCLDWQKGKMTILEAKRNLSELIQFSEDQEDRDHYFEVFEKILEEEEKCLQP